MIKICHLTSVHPRYDTRIFHKQCISLTKSGYYVYLIVADGKGDEKKNDINILDIGFYSNRLIRIIKSPKLMFRKALQINADIYHFHDPELISVGYKLLKREKKVIYDVHEDVPRQIMGKPYLNKVSKIILSLFLEKYENRIAKKFDYIITATPFIRERFLKINRNVVDINNYPIINELNLNNNWENKNDTVSYIGRISDIRGIRELIKALEFSKYNLNLAGSFFEDDLRSEVEKYIGWEKVTFYGYLSRDAMANVLSSSKAGIVTFLPLPNHINAQPNKIFEYMSAGIPVIASNFPLWKEIVEGNKCGICVEPLNPEEIANAIKYLLTHPKEAEQMGINGRNAVKKKYNWSNEEKKLIKIYERVNTLN